VTQREDGALPDTLPSKAIGDKVFACTS
jgi:hypothetical protein